MVLLWILVAGCIVVSAGLFMSAQNVKKQVAEAEAQKAGLQKELDDAQARKAALEAELARAKSDLREQANETKALKKKRWDEKKSVPAQAAAPSIEPAVDTARIERQWREAVTELDAQKARAAGLEQALASAQQKLVAAERSATEATSHDEAAALREQLAAEKQRAVADQKGVLDMRRKIEWYRRIYVVQQKELEKEQDKTAHVRQRFLDLCVDVVSLQKLVPNAVPKSLAGEHDVREVERLKQEQAAYRAAQEQQDEQDNKAAAAPTLQ
jgi:chromosome segregation ATPase